MRYINAHPGSSLYMHIILLHFKANTLYIFYFIFYLIFFTFIFFLLFYCRFCCNTCLFVTYFILLLSVHCIAPKHHNKFLVCVNLLGNKTGFWFWFWFWFWLKFRDKLILWSDQTFSFGGESPVIKKKNVRTMGRRERKKYCIKLLLTLIPGITRKNEKLTTRRSRTRPTFLTKLFHN